jgi:pilus assembly protein CpaF
MSDASKVAVRRMIEESFRPVAHLLFDPQVTEVMINPGGRVFVEKAGVLGPAMGAGATPISMSDDALRIAMRSIASAQQRRIQDNTENSILDADLDFEDQVSLRISAVLPPVSPDGPTICIRKHALRLIPLSEYVASGALTQSQADFLIDDIRHGHSNILVSGGTGTGKTTFLNALAMHIPRGLRILTLEDTLELQLDHDHLLRFKTDPVHGKDMTSLVSLLLRQRPSRAIAGELRGREASQVAELMNSGHSGIMTTIHANNAMMAMTRFKNLVMMAPERSNSLESGIAGFLSGIVGIVVSITRENGVRKVSQVVKVKGYDYAKNEFLFEPQD